MGIEAVEQVHAHRDNPHMEVFLGELECRKEMESHKASMRFDAAGEVRHAAIPCDCFLMP